MLSHVEKKKMLLKYFLSADSRYGNIDSQVFLKIMTDFTIVYAVTF